MFVVEISWNARNLSVSIIIILPTQSMKADIRKLLETMAACTRAAQALRANKGDNKTLLENLNQAWIAAERCRAWQEKI